MMSTLLGLLGTACAASLLWNFIQSMWLERYRDLFAATYQLAGRVVMNDDADDWPREDAARMLEAEQTLLLDILSDPDGAAADALLGTELEAADALSERAARPPAPPPPPTWGPYF